MQSDKKNLIFGKYTLLFFKPGLKQRSDIKMYGLSLVEFLYIFYLPASEVMQASCIHVSLDHGTLVNHSFAQRDFERSLEGICLNTYPYL